MLKSKVEVSLYMLNEIRAYGKKAITCLAKYVVLNNVNGSSFSRRCLLAYITKPFVRGTKAKHPNYFEAKIIVSVLDELGYCVDVVFFDNEKFEEFRKYDLIIGLGDCFDNSVIRCNDNAIRIYYATGANFLTAFSNEIKRWGDLYDRKGIIAAPSRFGLPRNPQLAIQSMKNCNGIITVGSDWCASTYSMWNKTVCQVGIIPFTYYSYADMNRNLSECKYNFLWLGGNGLVHKGLDIVIETFAQLPKCNLYIACNYEKGFFEKYKKELNMKNIHYLGFMNTGSDMFFELVNRCAYTICISCSEGTCTSVVTCMYAGLIPITSKESGINYGYQLNDNKIDSIITVLQELDKKTDKELQIEMEKSYRYVNENYTPDIFRKKFKQALVTIIKKQ